MSLQSSMIEDIPASFAHISLLADLEVCWLLIYLIRRNTWANFHVLIQVFRDCLITFGICLKTVPYSPSNVLYRKHATRSLSLQILFSIKANLISFIQFFVSKILSEHDPSCLKLSEVKGLQTLLATAK